VNACDAVILAGGRATPEMAAKTGTPIRALFTWEGRPFVQWAYEALRASTHVDRIAIVGPDGLRDVPGLAGADLLIPERDTITANLFAGLDALQPGGHALITACDNPLLSTAAFDDFLYRAPSDAAVAYPILEHACFLDRFPGATNTPIHLRDGCWIGGDCVLIEATAIPTLRSSIAQVLDSRKSLIKMALLLGLRFPLRLALRRATIPEVEQRVSSIAGVPFRFVRDCDPVFVVDIDDPVDWDYLAQWQAGANCS
jgi:CTP:molybdopterin cytidylyltransferase MocA